MSCLNLRERHETRDSQSASFDGGRSSDPLSIHSLQVEHGCGGEDQKLPKFQNWSCCGINNEILEAED